MSYSKEELISRLKSRYQSNLSPSQNDLRGLAPSYLKAMQDTMTDVTNLVKSESDPVKIKEEADKIESYRISNAIQTQIYNDLSTLIDDISN